MIFLASNRFEVLFHNLEYHVYKYVLYNYRYSMLFYIAPLNLKQTLTKLQQDINCVSCCISEKYLQFSCSFHERGFYSLPPPQFVT